MSSSTPHPLLASSPGTFLRVIRRYGVDGRSIPRVMGLGLGVLARQPLSLMSALAGHRKVTAQRVEPDPLFVVGHWRSGTTHLQNLLSRDAQFASVPLFHAALPHEASLMTEKVRRWVAKTLPSTRLMDNLPVGVDVPWEEELAMAACSRFSYYHISSFGAKMDQVFEDTVLLEDASLDDQQQWWKAYHRYLKSVQLLHPDRRLMLKNPANTARVRLLLKQFPQARFLHLHRHPYEVFVSTVHLHEKAQEAWGLQAVSRETLVNHVLASYPKLMQAWFDQKGAIPQGQLADMRFDDLVSDPTQTLKQAYEELELDGFEQALPGLEGYLAEQRDYKRNQLNLREEERESVATCWAPWFQALGYEP